MPTDSTTDSVLAAVSSAHLMVRVSVDASECGAGARVGDKGSGGNTHAAAAAQHTFGSYKPLRGRALRSSNLAAHCVAHP